MLVRRPGLALVALLALTACPKVNQTAPAPTVVIATFSSPNIPTPNDLALQAVPTLPPSAQKDLLQSFVDQGGFPADQAPTLTVPLRAYAWNSATNAYDPATALPQIDPSTVTATTAALFRVDVSTPQQVAVEATAVQQAGALTLVPAADASGSRRLAAGRYVFAVRGGANGVLTTDRLPIGADLPIALTVPDVDLTVPANQPPGGLTQAQLAQLVPLQTALWQPIGWTAVNVGGTNYWTPGPNPSVHPAYSSIDAAFPHADVASIAAFQIAPPTGSTIPVVDAASGEAPLPNDLLRTGPNGTIAYNPAFGPIAQGLATLQGFSTTAMLLAPVAKPGSAASAIDASTVNGSTVFLYKLGGSAPALVPEFKEQVALGGLGNPALSGYVAQPTPIIVPQGTQCPIPGGCSQTIGLQPAVGVPTPLGTFYLPPLAEKTSYAVVITNRVKDLAGKSLARPTFMTLLLDSNPLVDPSTGASLVGGVDAATAAVIEQMRTDLAPVFSNLHDGAAVADVVLAYTFETQPITDTALAIAALPYQQAGAGTVQAASFLTPAETAASYGIDGSHLPGPPSGPIAEFAEVSLPTISLLLNSQNEGAFDPAHPVAEPITALVAIPNPALVTGACPPGSPAFATTTHCAPLVVYVHGTTRSKADVLPVAAALTAQGFVVAAIDGEKRGDRSYCTSDSQCCPSPVCGPASGTAPSTCAIKTNFTTPSDGGTPIGVCESAPGVRGSYLNQRVDCTQPFLADGTTPNPACLSPKGIPYVSANYLITANFFRSRDSLRQDIIDESALVKALAPTGQASDAFANELLAHNIAVDFTKVYWVSQSLGSMQGAVDIAANPRIARAVFNAPGATVVDILANPASSFHAALLEAIAPIQENTPEYLQVLQIAKWVLDPAEPANFGQHVIQSPLASPLNAAGFPNPDRTGAVLLENAYCDNTVPNTQNAYFASQVIGPLVPPPGAGTTGYVQWYIDATVASPPPACPANGVGPPAATHGFLLDGVALPLTTTAQTTAARFLLSPSAQPDTIWLP